MGKEYEETGFNSITVIDENGAPHVLYETEEGSKIWKNADDNQITKCEKTDTGYTLYLADGTIKNYDEPGLLTSITDRNGNCITLNRDSNERLISLETSYSEKLNFSYFNSNITKIENVRSPEESVIYTYEGNRLVKVKDTDDDVVEMEYNTDGYMTALKKCDGSRVHFVYGEEASDGRVLATATTNEEGYTERFVYDLTGRKTRYIDHDNNATIYEYDQTYRTKKETGPDGNTILNDYDSKGNLISINENGSITRYSYDGRGNRIKSLYEDGSFEEWTYDTFNLILSYKDRDGITEEYIRDEKGNLIEYKKNGKTVFTQEVDSKGQVTRFRQFGQKTIVTDYEYDSFGNLTKESCGGIAKEYFYDRRNRLTEIKLNDKTLTRYEYDGHKTTEKKYNGLETTYLTNGRKDLVKISQKDTVNDIVHETRISYDRRHLPLAMYSGNGEKESVINSYLYTQEGKIYAEIFHGKQSFVKLYEYENGQISAVKQFLVDEEISLPEAEDKIDTASYERQIRNLYLSAGENVFVKKYSYELKNSNRKILAVTDGVNNRSLFEYDSWGNLIKYTDGNNETANKEYSKAGRVKAEETLYGGWYEYGYTDGIMTRAGEQGKLSVKTEYYPDGSIKSETDRYGKVTYYSYDDRARITAIESESKKIWYGYDDYDRLVKQIVGNSPEEQTSVYYITYEYSEDGRFVTVTEGGKYKIVSELDAFGNVIKQTNGDNNERSFVYNSQNQMIESYDSYGNKTAYEYNAQGNIGKVITPEGTETNYVYNYMGQLEKVRDDCGTVYEAVYDKAGRLIKERNRADSEKSYEYDAAGRVTKVLCGGQVVESYSYGPNNRTVTVKDGNGNDYLYNYDGFGRLVNERNRAGLEQNYYYDEEGQLKSKSNFDETTTTINYSSNRTVKTIHYSDGSENRFVYDALGNVLEAENAYGKTIYQYDQGGRLINQNDVTTGEELNFEYDDVGNRTRLYCSNRETLYTYGKNNELKEIFDNKQRISIKLEYDKNGREILRKFGNGTREETQYDKAGRVTVKTQKNERGSIMWGEGYVYGSDGKRTATVDNMGRVTLYEYNKHGRLETVYFTPTDGLIKNLKEEAQENGLPEVSEIGTNKYLPTDIRAELVLRLNSMQYGFSSNLKNLYAFVKESYSYDGNGNRKTKTTPYGTIEYTYDKENCLVSSGAKGKVFVNYNYDKIGNLLTEESQNKTTKYAYNAQNRLIYCEVTDKTKKEYAQTTYAYDAFGRRIIVQDKGEAALRTLYDGLTFDVIKQSQINENGLFTDSNTTGIRWSKTGKPTGDRYRYISEENANNNINYTNISEERYKTVSSRYRGERTQITANGTLAAQTTSDYGTEYFSTDLLGSVRTTSDSFGMAKSTVSYDVFGSLIEGSLSQNLDHGYLGKQHDPTSRLYNYGYRDYKSQFARFTTVDPIRDGENWFVYCNGDPINFVDLRGLCKGSDNNYFTRDPDQLVEDQIVKSETGNPLVVITFDGTTNNRGASIGRMDVYTPEQFNYKNEINIAKTDPKLSLPIISGSDFINESSGEHIKNDRIQDGFYKNAYKRKPNSELLQDKNHGGDPEAGSSLPIWDIPNSGDRAIHIANTGVDVNGGYTEGCPAITSNEKGKRKVLDNYNKFLIEVGSDNVDILVQ